VNEDSSEHSHSAALAISSGRPNRSSRLSRSATSRGSRPRASIAPSSIGVSIAPGQIALIRMPSPAWSTAPARVSPSTPCLEAV
jgi:hypothetical protein